MFPIKKSGWKINSLGSLLLMVCKTLKKRLINLKDFFEKVMQKIRVISKIKIAIRSPKIFCSVPRQLIPYELFFQSFSVQSQRKKLDIKIYLMCCQTNLIPVVVTRFPKEIIWQVQVTKVTLMVFPAPHSAYSHPRGSYTGQETNGVVYGWNIFGN